MRTTRLGLAILTASILVGLDPAAAPAQQPEIPAEVRARGRRLQEEAAAHVDAQRWALAADAYRQIYELGREYGVPQAPIALWDMGLALMRIPGREAEARDAFQRFLDESTTLTEDAEVRDWRSTALEHIAELDARIGASDSEPDESEGSGGEVPTAGATTPAGTQVSPVGPIVLGAGAAMLIASAITGGLALTEYDAITGMCDSATRRCPPELQARADALPALSITTDVLLWGGLAVAAVGALLTAILREGDGDPTAEPALAASCTMTGCVASFAGRF